MTDDILAGSIRSTARLIRRLEDDPISAIPELKRLYPHTGRAFLIGLTGSPGVGKSTLTDQLINEFRQRDLKVGVVAIDPTSPFSGGAILGDRVRMQQHATDRKVFIRSLATRGAFGGLSTATKGVVHILDAAGYDVILIETVGVGQDEIDIVRLAHTTLVISVPGLGDGIQAIKAGILEIADVLVVNKADRDGSAQTVQELQGMVELNKVSGQDKLWWPPVQPISAATGANLEDLLSIIDAHREFITTEHPHLLAEKIRTMSKELVMDLIKHRVMTRCQNVMNDRADWDDKLSATVNRQTDPYSLAEELYRDEFEKS